MPPASVMQSSFTGGEWSPSLHSRIDLAKYSTALRTLKNFIIHPHGPASNRGGLQFVVETKHSSQKSRLKGFQFSTVQSYMLEFGHQYIRVLKDGGQVIFTAGNGDDIVLSGTYKWTASGSGTAEYYLELNAGGDPGLSQPSALYEDVGAANTIMVSGTLGSLTASQWGYGDNDSLGYSTVYVRLVDDTDPDTKSNGYLEAGYPVEINTPYIEDDLALLKFEQSADVLYINHPDGYAERKLSRTAHDVWTLTQSSFAATLSAPTNLTRGSGTGTSNDYVVTAVSISDGESVASSAVTNNGPGDTWTWDTVAGADYYNFYKDSNQSGVYGWIGQANDATFTEPSTGITADFTKTPPIAKTPFSGTDNQPGLSAFYQQRLVRARTNNSIQTLFGSTVGNFENMNISSPLRDDDAFTFTINARQVNEIRWMVPLKDLIIGTSGSEWIMKSGANQDAITPTNVNLSMQSELGSSHVHPLVVNSTVLFIERSGATVRDFLYSLDIDRYTGNDLSLLAEHFFDGCVISDWAYQQHPDSIVWCVCSDGKLLGLTYFREHEVWGWHQHDTDGVFESIDSITTEDTSFDDVYFIVKRTLNGVEKRYIERFRPRLPINSSFQREIDDAYFVDSGLTLDSALNISGATMADPVVITATAHGFDNADLVDIVEVSGMTELNGKRFKVANKTTNTFELQTETGTDIDGTAYTAYLSGGKVRKAVTQITGLDHLEGEEVAVLADGAKVTGLTVSGGSITLTVPASRVHVGLPYVSELETLDIEYLSQTGLTRDKIRDAKSVVLSLKDTTGLWVGPSSDRIVEVDVRSSEALDTATQLFTGEVEKSLYSGTGRQSRVYIRNADPLPCTVTAIMIRGEAGEH